MQTIYLDISNKGVIPCVQAKQNEVGRKFLAVITDSGIPYEIQSDSVVSVWYEGASGKGNYTDIGEKPAISVANNRITVELIAQMLAVPGDGVITVLINSANGDQIGLWNIDYCVESVAGIESEKAEEYYTAFSEAAANLAKSAEEINSVIKAKNATAAGLIYPLASKNVPTGFLLCDGKECSRTVYEELFNAIGTTYGDGDGSTTFNVPNLQTRVPVGAGAGYELGKMDGEEAVTLDEAEMPSHYHDGVTTRRLGNAYRMEYQNAENREEGTCAYWAIRQGTSTTDDTAITYSTGGGQPHNNMQPYTVVNYIISTGKKVEFVVGGTGATGGGADVSIIDDSIVSTEKTWSSQKIADEISSVPSGGGGSSYPAVESTDHPGCYYITTADGKIEWVNPPMIAGVEYRTTERYNGKSVYAKFLNNGKSTSGTSVTLYPEADIKEMVSVVAKAYGGGLSILAAGKEITFPEAPQAFITVNFGVTIANYDVCATIKYTKD